MPAAKLLEALAEARLTLRFLKEGMVKNAARKAFQAWRALFAALLRLELDKTCPDSKNRGGEEVARREGRPQDADQQVEDTLLEEIGHANISAWTSLALNLHDYYLYGPDPDKALSEY
ncbi:MAG: PaREP1 family protein [Nitrososphaerota archaeon]